MDNKKGNLSTKSEESTKEKIKKTIHECQFCSCLFAHNSSLIKHIRIHTGDKPYLCNFPNCNQKFSQVSNLIRHKRIHNGVKPFSCHICQKTFTSSSNLKQHVGIHGSQFDRSKFVCIINDCKKSYLYICTLKKHLQASHKKENEEIMSKFSEEKNFISIYKKLINNTQNFPFIVIKSDANYILPCNSVNSQEVSFSKKNDLNNNNRKNYHLNNNYLKESTENQSRNIILDNFKLNYNNSHENIAMFKRNFELFSQNFIKSQYEREQIVHLQRNILTYPFNLMNLLDLPYNYSNFDKNLLNYYQYLLTLNHTRSKLIFIIDFLG